MINDPNIRYETITEVPLQDIYEPSGVFDEYNNKQLSNREFIGELAIKNGAFDYFTSMNGWLSPEAQRHNTQVTRSGVGDYLVAVIAKYRT